MRILLLIPLSILLFYLSWQELKSEHGIDKAIHQNNNSTAIEHFNNSTIQHSATLQPLTFICDRKSDSLELVKFYDSTGGGNWWKKWDLKKPMSTWFGIKLNSDGCVSGIYLNDTLEFNVSGYSGNNLVGSFPTLNLQNIKDFYLTNNKLTGNLSSFENLHTLENLGAGGNLFSGSIPNFDFPSLKSLGLGPNKLSGTIPQFNKLPKLEYLGFIADDSISGSLPDFDLPMLKGMELHQLPITGNIPNFTKMPSLEWIQIYDTKQISLIPNFNNLPMLKSLVIGAQLSGQIPDFNKMPNLESLFLGGNNHTPKGPIPDFNNLPLLKYLSLRDMDLSGPLPGFKNCLLLEDINIRINNLSGNIPDYYASHLNLNSLDFSDNKFTFENFIFNQAKNKKIIDSIRYSPQQKIYTDTTILIPPNTSYTLDLLIDDTVSTSTYTWYKNGALYKTIKGSNKLPYTPFTTNDAGTYTVKITNPLAPQLTLESHPIRLVTDLALVCDRRADSLELVKFYDSTGGPNWKIRWDLSTPIDSWFMVKVNKEGCVTDLSPNGNNLIGNLINLNLPNLQHLFLGSNHLTGTIPNFDKLPNLQSLVLTANPLIGAIPNFDKIPYLQSLNLRDTKLNGTIPNFDNLQRLEYFDIKDIHNISGSIPNFDKLPNLKYLNLNENNLTGFIPNFDKLPNLQNLSLFGNAFTGAIPNFDKLPNLLILIASANNLTGKVPNFDKLPNLLSLDLGANNLTGNIPNFDKLPNLQSLGLSRNILSGAIPNFDKLPHLVSLFLDNNQLSGYLPDYTQSLPALSSFNLENNLFTFSVLIQNTRKVQILTKMTFEGCNCPDSMVYHPQQKIYSDTTISVSPCNDYILDLKIDDTVTTSTYSWFKDGSPYRTIKGSNILMFSGFNSTNNGTYTVSITNPLAPQLTLSSYPIRLFSNGSLVNINNPKDTILSCGLSFILIPITGQNLTNAAYFTGPGRTGTQYSAGQVITSSATLYLNAGSGNCSDEDTFKITFTNKTNIILKPDLVSVKYQTPKNFDVLANDMIPGGIAVMVTIDRGTNGDINIISQSTGKGTYTPRKGFSGKEILNYKVCPVSCPDACSISTIEFDVEPPCNDKTNLVLPNVIFPEGSSGDNRYFIVEALNKCPEAFGPKPTKFMVYNRWGDQVFHSNDYKNDWDGNNDQGQPLPAGTYYYLLDLGGVSAPVKGYVVIMR